MLPRGIRGKIPFQMPAGGPGNPPVAEGEEGGAYLYFGSIAQSLGWLWLWLSGEQLKRKLVLGCCCAAAARAFGLDKGALPSENRQPGSLGVLFGVLLVREKAKIHTRACSMQVQRALINI